MVKKAPIAGFTHVGILLFSAVADGQTDERGMTQQILRSTGFSGGLIVHVGCGDGRLTAELGAGSNCLVHGLDADAGNVRVARRHIQSLGLYGRVSVDRLDGERLPYADNLVNLLVAENPAGVPRDEFSRVLAPGGVALVPRSSSPAPLRKPWPKEIDEWTHYLYDASNNAVSKDMVVGPPRRLQWVGGPKHARSHDHLASLSAAVSSGGRIFYIIDEGPTAAVVLEPRWFLVARYAFNGVVLWKRRIPKWLYHLRAFRSGPAELPRRLVAAEGRVYVTLGIDAPVSALDGATGSTITTCEGTKHAQELVYSSGTLYVVVGSPSADQTEVEERRPGFTSVRSQRPSWVERQPQKHIVAVDAKTGHMLWKKSDADTAELMPTTLAVGGGRVFFQNGSELLCLDARSGDDIWRAKRPASHKRRTASQTPTLVVYRDVVLSADRTAGSNDGQRRTEWVVSASGGPAPVELIAFSTEDGRRLWSCQSRECFASPPDVMVADGLVWTNFLLVKPPGTMEARDPRTGEVRRTHTNLQRFGHGRCYRSKATERYLVLGRSGVEFTDLATGKNVICGGMRGTCQYGVMPGNGLVYVPPHSCACFSENMLHSFNCLAPDPGQTPAAESDDDRLEQGPAYGPIGNPQSPIGNPGGWPTYRHDAARSGCTDSAVPTKLRRSWQTELGGKLSSLVVAQGKLFVAQIDAHTVHALDATSGRRLWSHTVGGRVDSPPTVWRGRVLFGSADGWVYCLRASDGELVWRFRAAPQDRRIVAFGQLESVWPVHGSVLVWDDRVYFAAGRSPVLDGGVRMFRLDAKTGRELSRTVKGIGGKPDVLCCDGERIYMRRAQFDLNGTPLRKRSRAPHLYSTVGFLDDSWWHRTYWLLSPTVRFAGYTGWPQIGARVPAGRILAFDGSVVYGFGRNDYVTHGSHVGVDGATLANFWRTDAERRSTYYQAFAMSRVSIPRDALTGGARWRKPPPPKKYRWTQRLPIMARAMVLAEDVLFLAGPPNILATDDPAAAHEGKLGGVLVVLSTIDGKQLANHPLQSPPVWDGMVAAGGCLYLAMTDGQVLCFHGSP